jgi:hypothetical protein
MVLAHEIVDSAKEQGRGHVALVQVRGHVALVQVRRNVSSLQVPGQELRELRAGFRPVLALVPG